MPPLFQKAETCALLNQEERLAILTAAQTRQTTLSRGRVVLTVESHTACDGLNRAVVSPPPEAARLVYQWEEGRRWQATALDKAGNTLCDVVSDGLWIETADQRWACSVFTGDDSDSDDEEDELRPFSEASQALMRTFQAAIWASSIATEHLGLNSPLASELLRHTPRLYRDTSAHTILWHFTQFDTHAHCPTPSLWRRFQWRITCLIRADITFEEFFGVPPTTLLNEALFEYHGDHLYPVAESYRFQMPEIHAGATRWRAPFRLEDDVWLPRVCDRYDAPQNGALRFSTALVPGECHLGEAAVVDIRAIDMSKPVVAT